MTHEGSKQSTTPVGSEVLGLTVESQQLLQKDLGLGGEFSKLRSHAREKFDRLGLPSDTDELWRQTKPDQFSFTKIATPCAGSVTVSYFGTDSGADRPMDLRGVSIHQNAELTPEDRGILSTLFLDKDEETPNYSLLKLHEAIFGSVTVIRVGKKERIIEPLSLTFQPNEREGAFAPLLVIKLEEDSELTLLEDLNGSFSGLFFPRVEIILGARSRIHFTSVQRLMDRGQYLGRHRIHCERDSYGKFAHVGIGSQVARLDLECRLLEPGASADLLSLTIGDRERHLDYHPTQEHLAPHCRSNLYAKAVLKEEARSVYYGYIRVADGAQRTDAYQTSRNLLLSPTARADAIPNLEIKANDVRCSHGASVGQVGEEELFYLRSRGLSQFDAERLLVEGFFTDVISRIQSPKIEEYLQSLVLERLNNGTTDSQA